MSSNLFKRMKVNQCQLFVVFSLVLVSISTSSFPSSTEDQTKTDSARLIGTLRENGVNIPRDLDYDSVVKKLKAMRVAIPEVYKKDAMNYLDRNADSLIHLPTSQIGILSWYFENVLFLRKDLIFARYSDGEMYGGDILIEVIHSEDRVISMRTLWNYHN